MSHQADNAVTLPVLESACPRCEGRGGETDVGEWIPCTDCRGAGYLPTLAGTQVLSLLRHNIRPLIRDSQRA